MNKQSRKQTVIIGAIALLCALVMLLLPFCFMGRSRNTQLAFGKSEKFTEEDFSAAVKCVKKKFRGFNCCELTHLWYDEKASDSELKTYSLEDISAENKMVLFSNFNVDKHGAEIAMEPGSTYHNWKWILVRESKGKPWKVENYGYA